MEYIKKILVVVLAILTLSLYLPKMALSQQQFASLDVPKHEPQSWGTPEEDIPTIKKKTSGWTRLIVAGLIGGVVWLLSQEEEEPPPPPQTGSYTASW